MQAFWDEGGDGDVWKDHIAYLHNEWSVIRRIFHHRSRTIRQAPIADGWNTWQFPDDEVQVPCITVKSSRCCYLLVGHSVPVACSYPGSVSFLHSVLYLWPSVTVVRAFCTPLTSSIYLRTSVLLDLIFLFFFFLPSVHAAYADEFSFICLLKFCMAWHLNYLSNLCKREVFKRSGDVKCRKTVGPPVVKKLFACL